MSEPAAPEAMRDLDSRRRRAMFRAGHRGTKEMDWVVGRFAAHAVGGLDEAALDVFERFLETPDPVIDAWVVKDAGGAPEDFRDLVAAVRRFHGL